MHQIMMTPFSIFLKHILYIVNLTTLSYIPQYYSLQGLIKIVCFMRQSRAAHDRKIDIFGVFLGDILETRLKID